MQKYSEYELDCRRMAERFALTAIYLSELNELQKKISDLLVEMDFGEWVCSTTEGEFHFNRHKPYYIDIMSEIEEEKKKEKGK